MAHLPVDDLPTEFDAIIEGTGCIQCIVAGALSRVGKRVLHLDRNGYYGDEWGSLMYRDMQKWIEQNKPDHHKIVVEALEYTIEKMKELELASNETNHELLQGADAVSNLVEIVHQYHAEPTPSQGISNPTPSQDISNTPSQDIGQGDEVPDANKPDSSDGDRTVAQVPTSTTSQEETTSPVLTWDSLEKVRRQLNFDIRPKLLHCRGQMIDLIVQSGVSRYLEFKAVSKLYIYSNTNKIVQVPCSRSDVFSSKDVTMLEKRMMMKFLTFCANYDQQVQEYQEYANRPFIEFLKHKELTPNLIQFIVHAIAMVNEDTPTIEGLQSIQVFIHSLGRYENAPFLYPIFGSGEIPQSFCRLCAVFGGVYCLKRAIKSVIVSDENKCIGITTTATGQQIKCSTLITSGLRLRDTFNVTSCTREQKLSRGIFVISNTSQRELEKIHVMMIPPLSLSQDQLSRIFILQVDHSSYNTPENTLMVHMTCESYGPNAQQDLLCAVKKLFFIPEEPDSNQSGPNLLWSLYYNIASIIVSQPTETNLPINVHIASGPDATISYEACVKEAKEIFSKVCPNEEFLPKIPDPEDIVYESDENQVQELQNDDTALPETIDEMSHEQESQTHNNDEGCHVTDDKCQEREQ